MGLFNNNSTVTTTFNGKDNLSPVVRGIRSTMQGFKRDASTGFGLAAGISVFSLATKAIDFAGDSLRAYADEQASVAKLTSAIRANAEAWDGNMDSIEAVIKGRMQLGFSDDEQRDSLALLVAQIGDVNDALKVQRTAMDLARLKNISLGEASTVLAKAYNGSTTALQKMGIKLKKGTDGIEAVEAVQQRAAGQAKAYSETLVGSAQVMAISFDEFKESVGGALNDALNPFFHLVVDLTNQAPDLDSAVGRLTDSYRKMIQVKADAVKQDETWDDAVTGFLQGVFMGQDKAIHDFTGTLGDYGRILGVTRKELALFTEAGLTVGKTLPEIKQVLDNLVSTQVAERAKDIGFAWQTGMDAIEGSTPPAVSTIRTLPAAVRHAVVNMKQTIKEGKAGIVEQFRDLAWQSKHPFAAVSYENWLERKQRAATRKMKEAAKAGKPGVVEQYRELIQQIHDEISGLPGYTAGIAAEAMAQFAAIGPAVTEAMGQGDHGVNWIPGHKNKKGRWIKGHWKHFATGGAASGTFVAGEYGPEVVSVGSARAHVQTAQASRGGDTYIVLDGEVVGKLIDRRLGRALSFNGMGG